MGTLTLADFRDEVRLVCGGLDAASPVWTDDRIDRRINWSYLWCSEPNHYRHPELEVIDYITLVANTGIYPLNDTFYMISGVVHAQDPVLPIGTLDDLTKRTKLDPIDIRELMTLERQVGRPSRYAYWNDRIYLSNTPDTSSVGQTLEVYGYQQPTVLTIATNTTVLRPEWDEIIVTGAEWRMWVAMNEHDRAYEAKQNLGALVNEVADIRRLHGEEWGWQNADSGQSLGMRID